ncbi:MAG: DUF885 domain-containing protein [Gammaproteobacteria bacterium]|nr:DUF885 domain-containing protein [Gammaproteobacteria bacterium]MBV9619500.1 DUF885 domain-containing protein [Gammaproteobacteria bacterium]
MRGWILLMLGAGAAGAALGAESPAWVTASNKAAQLLLEEQGKYTPEPAGVLGLERYDADILDLKPNVVARQEADLEAVAARYEAMLKTESDPQVREDLQILLKSARDQRTTLELNDRLMLPYFDLAQTVFGGFQGLLEKRVARSRYPAALLRLKRYAGVAPGYEPITHLARARIEERLGDSALTAPWSVQVEQELKNVPQYLGGIRDLLRQSGLKGWEHDFATLSRQMNEYAAWVRGTVLPRARHSNLLPPEIYADNLKQFGVSMAPAELIERALLNFAQTREDLQSLAILLAKEHGWASADYRDVLRELKKQRIPQDKLLDFYRQRLASIEQIVRTQQLISLPERAAAIRLATAAEAAAVPAPHMLPPRLIGNQGEPAEFVLNTSNPNAAPGADLDDFSYDAVAWTLTAHEARPGHELQFASMIEHGVSLARAVFAFNSANVEGWALYAEAFMKPYFPPEGQFGVLEQRLVRAARAFLDPMLNLGQMTPADAQAFLMREVGLSEPLAKEEIDRYTFTAPGQATSYFFGYSKLEALRERTQLALGEHFDVKQYHDFLLAQGLLPPELMAEAVAEYYVKPRLAAR